MGDERITSHLKKENQTLKLESDRVVKNHDFF